MKKSQIKFCLFVAVLILIVVQFFFNIINFNKVSCILDNTENLGYFPFIFVLLFIISSFFPLPFLTLMGARIFPFEKALIYSLLGNIALFIFMFYLARFLGKEYFEKYKEKNPKLKKLDINFESKSFLYIILLRLFFIIPVEFTNIIGGISEIKFKKYLTASIIGILPPTIASILLVKSKMIHSYSMLVIAIIIFALCILIPPIFITGLRKYFRKNKVG
jgi:uncharacterized membrane protein YdjX (TVP38/TMEM64 family)